MREKAVVLEAIAQALGAARGREIAVADLPTTVHALDLKDEDAEHFVQCVSESFALHALAEEELAAILRTESLRSLTDFNDMSIDQFADRIAVLPEWVAQ
ncbi:hypothetical protein [Croceicoccus gelatinilyticus]|uniref:hypothetical protein n=1 Tax=Croceicoccus gelatinilyticus TaxID=2835536 RepID=UPI001BCE6D83|nr:hypothetical protein [Croceicoccus gelatinilyticus]MBS7671503.1 hypothetical protein [Croceicoccus gelatinilyticus]